MRTTVTNNLDTYDGEKDNNRSVFATDIASYLLSLSEPGTPLAITPLKLQKLLYYVQGWYMAFEKVNLFNDDFVAWDHGPVIKNIYDKYRNYGYRTIPKEIFTNFDKNRGQILTKKQLKIINAVWDVYGEFDGKYLEQLTHQEEPWLNTPRNSIISKRKIRNYFVKLLNNLK
jgi:uncharacterized phage-associated protein